MNSLTKQILLLIWFMGYFGNRYSNYKSILELVLFLLAGAILCLFTQSNGIYTKNKTRKFIIVILLLCILLSLWLPEALMSSGLITHYKGIDSLQLYLIVMDIKLQVVILVAVGYLLTYYFPKRT